MAVNHPAHPSGSEARPCLRRRQAGPGLGAFLSSAPSDGPRPASAQPPDPDVPTGSRCDTLVSAHSPGGSGWRQPQAPSSGVSTPHGGAQAATAALFWGGVCTVASATAQPVS